MSLKLNCGFFMVSLLKYRSTTLSILKLFLKSQKSRHAMMVILRRSEKLYLASRWQPLLSILRGYLQALVLIFLTFLFGSSYQGDLFFTTLFVIAFATLIVISRTYSIYFCMQMEKALNITVIEYETSAELAAIKVILAGMPDVLVENITKRYKYSAGYRLDEDTNCSQDHDLPAVKISPIIIGRLFCLVLVSFIILLAVMYSLWGYILWGRWGTPMLPDDSSLEGSILILVYFVIIGCFLCQRILSDFDSINPYDIPTPNSSPATPSNGCEP